MRIISGPSTDQDVGKRQVGIMISEIEATDIHEMIASFIERLQQVNSGGSSDAKRLARVKIMKGEFDEIWKKLRPS